MRACRLHALQPRIDGTTLRFSPKQSVEPKRQLIAWRNSAGKNPRKMRLAYSKLGRELRLGESLISSKAL